MKNYILAGIILTLTACSSGMDEQQKLQNARAYLDNGDLASASIELRNTLQANAENAEARFLLGSIRMQIGDFASAEKEFRRAAQAGWNNEETQIEIARVLLAQREFQKLLDEIKASDTWSTTGHANLLGLRALAEAELKDISGAKTTLTAAAKYKKDAFHVLKTTAIFQLANIMPGEAIATLNMALTIFKDDPELLLLYANANMQQKNYTGAASSYRIIIEQDNTRLITANGRRARIGLARLQIIERYLDQAQETLNPLYKMNANDPEANYLGGLIAFEQGDYKLAEERILNLQQLAPDHSLSLYLMSKIKYALNDYDQAAHHLSSYLSKAADDLAARKLLALTYIALHQPELARSTLQPALANNPQDTELQLLISKLEFREGNTAAGMKALRNAVNADPENPALRKQLAVVYISMGETQQALKELQVFRGLSKNTQEADSLMIAAYLKANQNEKAIDIANKMLENDAKNPAVISLNGRVYAASGKLKRARKYFEQALRLENDTLSASVGLAEIEHNEGNINKAAELYEGLVQAGKGGTVPMVALAELAEQQGRETDMLNWLEQARESASGEIKPRIMLANYYLNSKQAEKADLVIQEAIKIAPENTEVIALQSRNLITQQRYNEALSQLNKLVKKAPESSYARVLLGETYARLGMLKEAHEHLSKALDLQPDQVLALGMMAELELKQGNKDRSLTYAKQLQRVQPELYLGHKLEGDAWMSKQDFSKANNAYTRAWERQHTAALAISLFKTKTQSDNLDTALQPVLTWLSDHPDDTSTRFFLATAYQERSQNNRAIQEYEEVLEKSPDNAAVLNNLAWLYSSNTDPRALDMAERAYQATPENPGIQDTYGWILIQQDQLDKGRRLLKQALEQLPDTLEIRYHYAAALLKSGDKKEGWQMLDKLLSEGKPFDGREDAQRLHGEYAVIN